MKSKKITESNINDSIFNANSGEWWIEDGAFKALHSFNLIRTKFLSDAIESYSNKKLKKTRILDVGCGGGIFCEPLARLGADVTGIDTNKKAIQSAKFHAKSGNLNIKYLNTNLASMNDANKFDIITCMEVLEHVDDVNFFIKKSSDKHKPCLVIPLQVYQAMLYHQPPLCQYKFKMILSAIPTMEKRLS